MLLFMQQLALTQCNSGCSFLAAVAAAGQHLLEAERGQRDANDSEHGSRTRHDTIGRSWCCEDIGCVLRRNLSCLSKT